MNDDYVTVCPECNEPMSIQGNSFRCLLCKRSLTLKQAQKQKNRRLSPAGRKLEALKRDGRITL